MRRQHDPFLDHVKVLRSGIEYEEPLGVIAHRGPYAEHLNLHSATVGSLCVSGVAIHLTKRQSKALRKALKALEANE